MVKDLRLEGGCKHSNNSSTSVTKGSREKENSSDREVRPLPFKLALLASNTAFCRCFRYLIPKSPVRFNPDNESIPLLSPTINSSSLCRDSNCPNLGGISTSELVGNLKCSRVVNLLKPSGNSLKYECRRSKICKFGNLVIPLARRWTRTLRYLKCINFAMEFGRVR
uniref:Uncharacterized protein n=1 Tax=Opuntia streptacantha TaxID=393608 RepID=A0A7C9EBF6_OPUST